jgi:hypothetical protein
MFWDSAQPPTARWFLAQLILDPEELVDTFLRNVSSHTATRRYIQEYGNIHN